MESQVDVAPTSKSAFWFRHCIVAALLIPASASGHGNEFILAKLVLAPAAVQLEVTVEYGSNPMVHSEEEAIAVLTDVLRLHSPVGSRPLSELAKPRFEKRSKFDPTSPMLAAESPGHEPLQVMTVIWAWKPSTPTLALEVPRGNPHNVLFWKVDPNPAQATQRWLTLIAGDHTPDIPIPPPGEFPVWPFLVTVILTLLPFVLLRWPSR